MAVINAIRFADRDADPIFPLVTPADHPIGQTSRRRGSMLSRSHAAHAAHTPWLDAARAALRRLARVANRAWRNAVTRRELAELDDRMLADIGVTRAAVLAEVDRFPWDGRPRRQHARRGSRPTVRQLAKAMWQRHRSRQRIAELDATMLKDIGVSFTEAEAEANKPFWRA
jgi:uncharacterized protein YjiS (DUF1127 family)